MIHDSIGVSSVIKFFEYNWQVRDQWFTWCHQLTTEELLKNRLGGVENIYIPFFILLMWNIVGFVLSKEKKISLFSSLIIKHSIK